MLHLAKYTIVSSISWTHYDLYVFMSKYPWENAVIPKVLGWAEVGEHASVQSIIAQFFT